MTISRRWLGALAVPVVALTTIMVLPGAQALTGPGVVTISAVGARHTYLDEGEPGKGVGDVDVYVSLLYNKRITPKSIGRATMVCTQASASSQSCAATYVLPRGEIVVQGVIGSRLIYALAVVGGTGIYDNVRGSLTVTSLHRAPVVRELLVFRLNV
jgi:hypothetical protein